MSAALTHTSFNGFETRLDNILEEIDQKYVVEYERIVGKKISEQHNGSTERSVLGESTKIAIRDATDRALYSKPIAGVAAAVASSGTLKAVTATIAKKLATKVAAKASAKGVAKGGGILAGAGGGALLCSWSGPGAAVCGVIGGGVVWLISDVVIINIDEFFNRDEFEAELVSLIKNDQENKRTLLLNALNDKALQMDAATEEYFKLKDLRASE